MNEDILKNIKILLVEDEENLASLLQNAIADYFSSFDIANTGSEGIEKFKKINPDIVITDIMMPDLTGLEMARELKKINHSIPIIILSAFSETDKLLNAIDVGVIKYFIKPFDPDELLKYITSISSKINNKLVSLEGGFTFNKLTNKLYKDNNEISLSKRESSFLALLLHCSNDIVEESVIKDKLWDEKNVSDERLRTFIKRLRIKTDKNMIKNIKGKGYEIVLS